MVYFSFNIIKNNQKTTKKIWRNQKKTLPLHPLIMQTPSVRIFNSQSPYWRDGRVVDYNGLENRRTERYRGFESLSLRKKVLQIERFAGFFYYSTYRASVNQVTTLNTLQAMNVNATNVYLCKLAEHDGIDYEQRGISVRGHIYWTEFEDDEDGGVHSFDTESA